MKFIRHHRSIRTIHRRFCSRELPRNPSATSFPLPPGGRSDVGARLQGCGVQRNTDQGFHCRIQARWRRRAGMVAGQHLSG